MTARNAGELALALQSARGSVAAVSTQRSYVVSQTLDPTFGLNPNPELRTGRIGGAPWRPATGGQGDTVLIVRPKMIGLLLYAALGGKSVSGAGDPYTHTFTLASSLPWLTAWRHFGEISDVRLMDARITKLVISSRSGFPVTAQVSLAAASAAYRSAKETTVAVETADPLLHYHGAAALLVEGVAFSSISDWTLTIETGVALEQSLAGPMPRLTGPAKISLTIAHVVTDAALWNRMIFGSASPADLAPPGTVPLTLGGSPVGVQFTLTEQSAPERSLRIALPQVALGPMEGFAPVVGAGPVQVRTNLVAYRTPSPYADYIMSLGPVGYWRLGEPSGTVALDSSGNGNHGTYVGGPTLGVPGLLAGDPDTAVTLNGTTQYVALPSGTHGGGNEFTFAAWYDVAAWGAGRYSLIWPANSVAGHPAVEIGSGPGGAPSRLTFAVPSIFVAISVDSLPAGRHRVAVTHSGVGAGSTKMYLDGAGIAVADITPAQVITNTPDVRQIGARSSTTQFLPGTIDEPVILDRALSPGEIATAYALGSTVSPITVTLRNSQAAY